MQTLAVQHLDAAHVSAAHAAAAVMAMNNVYYRFLHLVQDEEYAKLPARLRMNVIGNPGIDKVDFELLVTGGLGDQRLRHVRGLARAATARTRMYTRSGAKRGAHSCHRPRRGASARQRGR